jgi:hypothetical protein
MTWNISSVSYMPPDTPEAIQTIERQLADNDPSRFPDGKQETATVEFKTTETNQQNR